MTAIHARDERFVEIDGRRVFQWRVVCGQPNVDERNTRKRATSVTCRRCLRSLESRKGYPWLVFCGSLCALVWGRKKTEVLDTWRKEWFKSHDGFVQAARHEVRARRMRVDDEPWIMASADDMGRDRNRWLGALAELKKRERIAA